MDEVSTESGSDRVFNARDGRVWYDDDPVAAALGTDLNPASLLTPFVWVATV